MENEIKDIVTEFHKGLITKGETTKKLLALFSVKQRNELLLFADYSEIDKASQATDECVDNYLGQKQ